MGSQPVKEIRIGHEGGVRDDRHEIGPTVPDEQDRPEASVGSVAQQGAAVAVSDKAQASVREIGARGFARTLSPFEDPKYPRCPRLGGNANPGLALPAAKLDSVSLIHNNAAMRDKLTRHWTS